MFGIGGEGEKSRGRRKGERDFFVLVIDVYGGLSVILTDTLRAYDWSDGARCAAFCADVWGYGSAVRYKRGRCEAAGGDGEVDECVMV